MTYTCTAFVYQSKRALTNALLPFVRYGLITVQKDGSYSLNKRLAQVINDDASTTTCYADDGDIELSIHPRHLDHQHMLELWITRDKGWYRTTQHHFCTLCADNGLSLSIRTLRVKYPTQEHTP